MAGGIQRVEAGIGDEAWVCSIKIFLKNGSSRVMQRIGVNKREAIEHCLKDIDIKDVKRITTLTPNREGEK